MRRKRSRKHTSGGNAAWAPGGMLWKRAGYPVFKTFELSELAKIIALKSDDELATLNESFCEIAYSYWDHKNDVTDKPPAAWYRSNIKVVEKAAQELLSALQKQVGTGYGDLTFWFKRLTGRELLNQSDSSSLVSYLSGLIGACKTTASRRAVNRGPIEYRHAEEAAASLIAVWESQTEKKFPRSYKTADSHRGDAAIGNVKGGIELEFESRSAHFVYVVMHRIDPEITLSAVRTALRKCLSNSKEV